MYVPCCHVSAAVKHRFTVAAGVLVSQSQSKGEVTAGAASDSQFDLYVNVDVSKKPSSVKE